MRAFFIYNNLKVDAWRLQDGPLPGFELLTWDHESSVHGTLWDLGVDAGYTPIGIREIEGQIWLANDLTQISELEYYLGAKTGLTEPMKTKARVHPKDGIPESIDVTVYRLREIKSIYNIVSDGKWNIKRGL